MSTLRFYIHLIVCCFPLVAWGVPGPDSTAVVANSNVPESVAMARAYSDARQVPANRVCTLPMSTSSMIGLNAFHDEIAGPLEACLREAGVFADIEAVVLMKGVPLKVEIPFEETIHHASTAATLMTWQSTTDDGDPLLERTGSGVWRECGDSPCLAPRLRNPYRDGPFGAGWHRTFQRIEWSPILVTALEGRSFDEALVPLESGLRAEEMPDERDGLFLLMAGADSARGVLDVQYPVVAAALTEAGVTVDQTEFDPDLTGESLAGFVTGTPSIQTTIEGNEYLDGSIVDNLTSFGAVPENFAPQGESQVSIARWVSMGVAGVHGTTHEPLNSCFPDRQFLVDHVRGYTIAESFHRNLPFALWQNLVIGDPMAAPYATRPAVTIERVPGRTEGEEVLILSATDVSGRPIERLRVLIDGHGVLDSSASSVHLCIRSASEDATMLSVAQVGVEPWSKGWKKTIFPQSQIHLDCPEALVEPMEDMGVGASDDMGSPPVDAEMDAGNHDAHTEASDLGVGADVATPSIDVVDGNVSARPEGSGCELFLRPHGMPQTTWGMVLLLACLLGSRRILS